VTHIDPRPGADRAGEDRAGEDRAGDHAVATHGLTKRYGRESALDRVDVRVPDGSVYVLVGVNGAGKSTLFKLLMNLERPDAGTAQVFGLDTGRDGPEVRAQVGYVPERQDAPYPSMTCARLLRHAAAYHPAWDHAYADRLARALGVRPERRVGALSKGETRRLQLVLALAHRPRLLLLDEPTDGLDPVVRRRALALLAEHLADAPTTVVISTHHLHELESLADHVGVLRDGRLVAQMPREELQRTVRRYRLEVPDRWEAPRELQASGLRRSSAGRDVQCTLVGEEREVAARLAGGGARVRQVSTLALEDAALAFLPEDPS
jgi:ABC-2 type transport system ATP-binding protein